MTLRGEETTTSPSIWNRVYPPEAEYLAIEAHLGWEWLSRWKGRLTDAELQRQEDFSREFLKSRAHEAECEAAAVALLTERAS